MTTPLDFETLVARHQGAVCAIAYAVLRDRARSEEVAQEAFLIAWQKLPGMVPAPSLPGWVCGIARNLARNAARRRRETPMTDEPVATAASPLDQVLARENVELADRALATLSAKEREAVVLYYRGDESLAAVAVALGISEAAAKKRVTRGRAHLREAGRGVETTLHRTRPTAAFTAGCVAALAAGATKATAGTLGAAQVRSVGSKLVVGGAIAVIAMATVVWAIHPDPPTSAAATSAAANPPPTPVQPIEPVMKPAVPAPAIAAVQPGTRARVKPSASSPAVRPAIAPAAVASGSDADLPKIARVKTFDFSGGPLAEPIPKAAPHALPAIMDKRELREALRVVQPLVRDCYDRDGHGAHGTLQLVVRLEGDPGSSLIATAAKLEGELATNDELAECVKQALLSIEVAPLEIGGAYEIMYPFTV